MSRKKLLTLGVAASLCLGLGLQSQAQTTTLSDLQAYHNAKHVITDPGKPFDKSHWAYHSLKQLSNKYGLLLGEFDEKPLTRSEAAVILVNLVGKIEKEKVKVSDVDKAHLKIMKNEFSSELNMLTGRVAKLEEASSKSFKAKIGEDHQLGGVIQARYVGNFLGRGDKNRPSNLSIPIADVTLQGKLREHLYYKVNMFPSRRFDSGANGLLGDIYIATDILPKHKIYLGQTRKPIGYEGSASPYTLETVERAQIARSFGDRRDTGVKVVGDWGLIDYMAGVYNGSGINTTDTNSDVEYAFVAAINPLHNVSGYGKLKLGGAYDYGKLDDYSHNTYGAFAEYKLGKYMARAEYSQKNGHGADRLYASGWYVHNSYFLTDKLQLVARMDMFDENLHSARNRTSEYTGGVNYYFDNHNLKVQCNFVYVRDQVGSDSKRIVLLSQYMF